MGDPGKSPSVAQNAVPAKQKHDRRSFLPIAGTTIEPAINDVVLCELAWSGRREAKVQPRVVGIELYLSRFALGRNKVRPFQEVHSLVQPQASIINFRDSPGGDL